jgi:hypothetical protein
MEHPVSPGESGSPSAFPAPLRGPTSPPDQAAILLPPRHDAQPGARSGHLLAMTLTSARFVSHNRDNFASSSSSTSPNVVHATVAPEHGGG